MAEKIPSRQELAREDTWAIEDLYETDEAWLSDLEKLKALGARLPGYAGKISADAKTLLEYQRLGEEISLLLDSLANYAQRKSDEDTRNPVYQDLTGKLTKVWVQLGADTAFEVPELLSISDERMEEFYREEPELTGGILTSFAVKKSTFSPRVRKRFWRWQARWQARRRRYIPCLQTPI